jgi:glycosyltransferase involved in cell wall biosynthesis
MKIIVSHSGKQHVNALLVGFLKYHLLEKFYTSLAANKVRPPNRKSVGFRYAQQYLNQKLQKRYFKEVDSSKIIHFPFIFLLSRIIKTEYESVRYVEKLYDKWVAQRLKKEQYDILIGYENCNLESFKTAKKAGKITVLDMAAVHHQCQNPILTAAGTYTPQYNIEYICQRKDEAYEYTDFVFALSKFAEKTMIEGGIPANRIYLTYLGINQSVFTPKPYKQIEEEVLNLYFVGTMSHRKGLPFLISLLKNLMNRGRNVQLTLIGPIDDFDAKALNEPNCRYVPFLNHTDLVAMHHALDLFIFPSNIDSWAQVVIEAMACGSPILVSENTGAKDAVEQGGGLVLPVGDLEAWTEAVEKVYFNRFLLKKWGNKAAIVAKQYSWEAYHEQVYAAVTDIYAREKGSFTPKSRTVKA